MSMEGLGRVFNVVPEASGLHIPLQDAEAITFVGYEDGGATNIAFNESKSTAGASEQDLEVVARYWTSNGVGGAWTLRTQTAEDEVDPSDDTAQDGWLVTIRAAELSDGFTHVEATADAGTCFAILHDLTVQRDPANLAALI